MRKERERENGLSMMYGVRRSLFHMIEIWRKVTAFPVNARSQLYTKGTRCYLIQRNHKSGACKNIWQQLKMFCKCAYIFINMAAEAEEQNKCASPKVIWKSKNAINYFVMTTLFNFISGDLSALIQNWNFNTKLQPATEAAYLKTQSLPFLPGKIKLMCPDRRGLFGAS